MFELFVMGGPLFMSLITLAFLGAVVSAIRGGIALSGKTPALHYINYVKHFGLLALVLGVLGQLIGLYSAFSAIEQAGDVSQALLAGGLKVSAITTLWGLICYALSLIMALGLTVGAPKEA